MVKHHSQAVDFSNLDFKAIDTDVLVDEAKEQEEATKAAIEGNGATEGRPTNEGHVDEVVTGPWKKTFNIFLLFSFFFFENFGYLMFWGFSLKTMDILDAFCFEAFISRI